MADSAFSLLSQGMQQAVWRLGWTALRPIQADAIRTVLTSPNDLIVSAPTAGGKTEAAFLPILSLLDQNHDWVAIYISPLKALINDQWNRLDLLCRDLDIPIRRWHGDISATEKKAFRENPRGVLLITPESLESNFVNYGRALPNIYGKTAFIVIDELHVFVDGVRGMHLRSLIARLRAATGCQPRSIGLSATLGDPALAQAFLQPDHPEQVELIVETSGTRQIMLGVRAYLERPRLSTGDKLVRRLKPSEAVVVADMLVEDAWKSEAPIAPLGPNLGLPISPVSTELPRDALDEIADDVAGNFQAGSNLIFGNSRRTLEELADLLHEKARDGKWQHDPFHVHHGSLSKSVREDVEATLRDTKPATALCTSTLELGIDIGNIRTVGQIDPPWSVAAAMQRLGRSGRRAGEPSRMRIYARDETPRTDSSLTDLLYPRLLRSIAIVQLMLSKWVESKATERLHLSTLVHQLMSILRQTGGVPAPALFNQLCADGPFRQVDKAFFIQILRGLGDNGIIEQTPTGELILDLRGERITAEHDFYAAFASNEIFAVRHDDEQVGEMPADAVPPEGQCFILNGRRWEVAQVGTAEKTVWVKPTRQRVPPLFSGDGGDVDAKIFQTMQDILNDDHVPVFLDEAARQLLTAARKAALESGASTTQSVDTGKSILWYPWTGTKVLRTLRLMLTQLEIDHEYDELSLNLSECDTARFAKVLRQLATTPFTAVELAAEMEIKAFDKFDELLPSEVVDQMNARDRIDLQGALKVVANAIAPLKHSTSS